MPAVIFNGSKVKALKETLNMGAASNGIIEGGDASSGAITIQSTSNATRGVVALDGSAVRGPDGSASLPGYSFSSDTDTGLYRSGANELQVITGTSANVVFNSNSYFQKGILGLQYDGGGASIRAEVHNTGTAAGDDSQFNWETNGQQEYALGIDRSASGNFKLSQGGTLGTNDLVDISSAGAIGLGRAPTSGNRLTVKSTGTSTIPIDIENAAGGADIFRLNEDGSGNGALQIADSGNSVFVTLQVGGSLFGNPTGGAQGAGSINAENIYDDGVIVTDYVFESYYSGKPKDEQHASYKMKSLDEEIVHTKENFHLSTIVGRKEWEEKAERSEKVSVGQLVNQLWETVETQFLYIAQLHERLAKLEGK